MKEKKEEYYRYKQRPGGSKAEVIYTTISDKKEI